MTEVCYCETEQGLMLCADGHATGNPEVCNGLSALLATLRNWIWNTRDTEGWAPDTWTAEIEKGRAVLRAPWSEKTLEVFKLFYLGIALISDFPPEALSISWRCGVDCPHGRR